MFVTQSVSGTLGNRGLRSHTELDGHGAYVPVAIQGNLVGRDAGGPHGVGASTDGAMYTLTNADTRAVAQPVPYDLFQITAPVNRQNRQPGDPCHTLARDNAAHAAVAFAIDGGNQSASEQVHHSLRTGRDSGDAVAHAAVAFPIQDGREIEKAQNGIGVGSSGDPAYTVDTSAAQSVAHAMTVRRLTPRECERLQGFPDDYTAIPWRGKAETPDGPRYKALGNSMAVNCMAWIGERIQSQGGTK